MRKLVPVAVALVFLATCAAGANPSTGTANAAGELAGFWRGLWHGCIAPIAFVVSLFEDGVGVYEVHNKGGWYDLGFLLGLSCVFGGGGGGAARARR